MVGEIDNESLKEKLIKCRHFPVDSEMENGRHSVFDFYHGHTECTHFVSETSHSDQETQLYSKVDCVALAFVFERIDDGTSRYYYAHQNNTLMERSKLVVTKDDLVC